jgi:uncharacterized repeat protein (TIGR02543 family)
MRHNTFKLALAVMACLCVFSFAQIPVLSITTENNREPTSTKQGGNWMGEGAYNVQPYVAATKIEMTGSNFNFNVGTTSNPKDSLRIRGNSTADADKKPYRIKFGSKTSMFGKTAAKSWVLLADYYDGTFALNSIAFRLGHKMGLDFTHNAQHVEVYINGQNKGIYTLTEQNQVNPGRVDIREKKDWFAEFDYHPAAPDEIKFETTQYKLPVFIKSPEVESQFNVNNPTIKFVVDELNALTNKMAEGGFPNNGYHDMLDLESWVKYVLIQQLMDNFDFNSKVQDGALPGSNFCYRDSTGKIKAGPLWDFDLSAGVEGNMFGGSFPRHYQTYQEAVEPKHAFYKRLWADPMFKAGIKFFFDEHKSDIDAIPTLIDSISGVLGDRIGSSNKWANNSMMGNATLNKSQHETEVRNLKNWWTQRVNWFGQQIAGFDKSIWTGQVATLNVTFNSHGGNSIPAQTVPQGGKVTKPADPTRQGCTFDGWYKDSDLTTAWNFNTDVVNGKVTLHAKWNGCSSNEPPPSQAKFTVTFNTLSNSAQPTPAAQTVDQGAKAAKPADMSRQPAGQWAFMGWCTENGSTSGNWGRQWNFTADAVNADVYLYAQWVNADSAATAVTCNAPTSITVKQSALPLGNLTAIKNGLAINAASNAAITVFNLNGNAVRKLAFARGNHTVKLEDLPKGMYIVKATFGKGATPSILRVTVR